MLVVYFNPRWVFAFLLRQDIVNSTTITDIGREFGVKIGGSWSKSQPGDVVCCGTRPTLFLMMARATRSTGAMAGVRRQENC